MRRRVIAGNWKMNKVVVEAIALANGLKRELAMINEIEIIICPPFTALDEVFDIVGESNIRLGAQNMHAADGGAFTGEVSAAMIKDVGCQYVILGHSERRQFFHETNASVNVKVRKALQAGLTPIVCVGENLEEREAGRTLAVIEDHLLNSLEGISAEEILKSIIAYEPVWAIGTGKTASPAQAQEVHAFIRSLLAKAYSASAAAEMVILYGGSVKPSNISALIGEPDIDGALVGGASLDVKSFSEIVRGACC